MTAMAVATVDFRSPDAPRLLTESLHDTGFAVLVHHPLPDGLVDHVQVEWLAWFGGAAKYDYLPAPGAQDGYHPQSAPETAVGASVPDIKEFFHWYPWGQQPSGLGDATAELYGAARALGTTLLGWVEESSPAEVVAQASMPFSTMLEGATRTLLRILRYPPLTGAEPPGALRAAAHEDINLVTVLPAANRPGLQVLDRAGAWHDVPCDPGSVVVNSGDMLALASAGYFPSTTHRVLLPTGEDARYSRVATPLFLHPADDVELAGGATAFSFLQDRIRQIRGVELSPGPPAAAPR
jgi:isopenicillin N synthase-like dioxygenase